MVPSDGPTVAFAFSPVTLNEIGVLISEVTLANNLQTLRLHRCGLDNDMVGKLATFLETNSTIVTASFDSNEIGDRGASLFAGSLRKNTRLETLSLCENPIGDEGATCLLDSLELIWGLGEYNLVLRKLDLSSSSTSRNFKKDRLKAFKGRCHVVA
eukprot:m.68126 g.68126  ORF g.68126 m.68126 type:complete len:156 (-) comp50001_c0_seq3:94-561(-)